MKKIKIVHILHCVGGVEVSLRLILKNIDSNKFENIVIHGVRDTDSNFMDDKNNIIKNYKIPIFREISFVNDLKAIYETYKILKTEKPDIIHAHSAKGGIIGRLVGIFFKSKILFTPQAFSYLSEEKGLKREMFLFIEKLFSNTDNILLASSYSELERGINDVGYKRDKTILFNNCINPISVIQSISIPKTWPDEYICTVGRPSFQKNIELMLEILFEINKSQNIHLVLMGVGHHVGQLESVLNKIEKLSLKDKVTLLNWTKREDVLNIISNSKLYISTARYEGLPYSIIESLALSKPCVVSDCDGNRDLIINGYNGYIIKNNEVRLFKEKILDLLNNKNGDFSVNALKSFNDNYNIISNIKQLENIYCYNSVS